jgi:hypothetical protein
MDEKIISLIKNFLVCGPKTASQIYDWLQKIGRCTTQDKIYQVLKNNSCFGKTDKKGRWGGNLWRVIPKNDRVQTTCYLNAQYTAQKYD